MNNGELNKPHQKAIEQQDERARNNERNHARKKEYNKPTKTNLGVLNLTAMRNLSMRLDGGGFPSSNVS